MIIIAACIAVIGLLIYSQHQKVNKYDYLEVLHHQEWKSGRLLREELEELKGGWISAPQVCAALGELEDEKLVERRVRKKKPEDPDIPIEGVEVGQHEFKLTEGGLRRKSETPGRDRFGELSLPHLA